MTTNSLSRRAARKPADPIKRRARWLVANAIRDGRLTKPRRCSRWGNGKKHVGRVEAHHEDYSKPLNVEWLCARCHDEADDR